MRWPYGSVKRGQPSLVGYVGAEDKARATCEAVVATGSTARILQVDQRDPDAIDTAVANIDAKEGRLDVLVNNAAWNIGIPFPDLDALTPDIWDRVLETNLRGPFLLARAAAKLLAADAGGHIVNISSARRY